MIFYEKKLWKYDPFVKIPRLHKEYEGVFISSYDSKERKVTMTIKQSLLSVEVILKTDESKSKSLSASIDNILGESQLTYSYLNTPNASVRERSAIHYGTAMLCVDNPDMIEGTYFSDRKTTGDMILDRSLSEAGGKGLFTRELDQALLDQKIDCAVHSSKDLPTLFPEGILFGGCLLREDVRDAFICLKYKSLDDLPPGAVIGSASLRRQALIRMRRPDLNVTLLRGNVNTRLKRLEEETIDATLLAMAGLNRLGYAHHATQILEVDQFLPAVGQGAIGLSLRENDDWLAKTLNDIIDPITTASIQMERAFLRVLDGSCRMPIAGYACPKESQFHFTGQVLRPDGSECLSVSRICSAADIIKVGQDAGLEIKQRMPEGFLG